jgi:hypothetical protein
MISCFLSTFLFCIGKDNANPLHIIETSPPSLIPIITKSEIIANGTLNLPVNYTRVSNYGITPNVEIAANSDNSCAIAWYELSTKKIHIIICDENNTKVKEIIPSFISNAGALLGFTKVSDDNSYVVGYSKDNVHGNKKFEYWVSRFDESGAEIFSTRLFGDKNADSVWAKGEPGTASTARIQFNNLTKRIACYCGHSMKWDDNVRHQGGYICFLDLNGKVITKTNSSEPVGNTWFYSHNFDQRLYASGDYFYTLAHGDAYPRSLGLTKWTDKAGVKNPVFSCEFFKISGSTGDNTTNTQLGGFAQFKNGTFGVIFSSSNGRNARDICFKTIDGAGIASEELWLTSYTSPSFAIHPRAARFGAWIFLAWEEVSGGASTMQYMVLDSLGRIALPKTNVDGVHVSTMYDIINLPDGDIAWAVPSSGNKIILYRIECSKL